MPPTTTEATPWQTLIPGFTALQTSVGNVTTHHQTIQQAIAVGTETSQERLQGMKTIRETMAATSDQIYRLDSSTQQIANAINLIRHFAAQTHLLALKASIEAARAGENGRGFSVIADEVRGLAAQSAEATAAIEALVVTIQSEARELGSSIKQTTQQLNEEGRGLETDQQQWQVCAQAQEQLADALLNLQSLVKQQNQLINTLG
ncbi:MAG: methyl-accepting chemotaxis protein [Synechocystis sp.]|nr:methyl-accepting chemotaxis protein [Synechocystis sp.]